MLNLKVISAIAVCVLAITLGWQVGSCEVATLNLQEDMQDMAAQAGARIGALPPSSDEDVSRAIIRKAKEHGIDLDPTQVTVQRSGSGVTSSLYLAAHYTVPIHLAFFSFRLHFAPSSKKKSI